MLGVGGGKLRLHKKHYSLDESLPIHTKLPIIGEVISKASIARFTRTLATTFNAGIPFSGISCWENGE